MTTPTAALYHGRLQTPQGEVLVWVHCAFGTNPPQFTYLHGYCVCGGQQAVQDILRNVGGKLTGRTGNVLCTFCNSYLNHSLHEGFFRLWRSVKVPPSQHANVWAAVDKRGWVPASVQELVAAAEALRDAQRLPMMMGRDGSDDTPAAALLDASLPQIPALAAEQPGAGVAPSSGVPARPKAPPSTAHAPRAAAHLAYSAHTAVVARSAAPPVDQGRLANLEAEVSRQAAALSALQLAFSDLARRVGP